MVFRTKSVLKMYFSVHAVDKYVLVNFSGFCCHLLTSSKLFFLNYFRNAIRVQNGLDPDQELCFVGPDLGPNCLQGLSAENKSRY